MTRFVANISIILAIILMPWWFVVVLAVAFSFLFNFLEIMVYGMVLDSLYSVSSTFLSGHIFLIGAFVLYVVSAKIRPNLRSV